MANGITQGLTDILGIDTNAGDAELQQALAALNSVGVPTEEQLKLPELQKYVQAGVLTPQQYQAIMANPQAYSDAIAQNQDSSGMDAQKSSIEALNDIINSGGSTAINQATLKNNLNQTNQAMQASRAGIEDNAKQRGVYGGGLEFLSKLLNEQGSAENANLSATNAAADNAKLALQAITQKGQLGGQLQGQSNQMAQSQADAARQIAEYNSQLQTAANQYNTQAVNDAQAGNAANLQDISNRNTGGANDRTKYNAQIPQTIFQDNLAKQTAIAGNYKDQSGLNQQQEQMGAGLTGSLIGAGADVYGNSLKNKKGYAAGGMVGRPIQEQPQTGGGGGRHSGIPKEALMALAGVMAAYPMLKYGFGGNSAPDQQPMTDMGMNPQNDQMNMAHGGMCYAQGGEVHDHDLCMEAGGPVPGDESGMPPMQDDESQDVVDAHLSPGEVVLPRSVSQAPNAPEKAASFMSQIGGQSAQPMSSFADALAKLEENGLELRLAPKGM